MRLALISDIHGNLEALTAVLDEIGRHHVDVIHCLGDVVGYGCNPIECLDLVEEHCAVKLMGNHEQAVMGRTETDSYNDAARAAADWTRDNLGEREFEIMSGFTIRHDFEDITLVHASPFEPENWHYILTPAEAAVAFQHFDGSLCFHGHSHIPVIFAEMTGQTPRRKAAHDFDPSEEGRYLVNVGSVGQPRDNDPRACFVILDTEERTIDYLRVEYDIPHTQAKMADAQLPDTLVERLAAGR